MKKVIQFLEMPFVQLLTVAVSVVLMFCGSSIGIPFIIPVSLIIYIFLGGFLFSKIESKKIKVSSAIFTAVLLILSYIAAFIASKFNSDSAYFIFLISPLSNAAIVLFPQSFLNGFDSPFYEITATILSVIPVVIMVVSAKIFNAKNKKLKKIILIILAVFGVINFGIGIISAIGSLDDAYIGDDGGIYTAYFDVNGVKYEDDSEVPYYDTEGNVYYWTYDESIDVDSEEYYSYIGELTDEQGKAYDIHKVYVNNEGYIFIDENDELEWREDIPDDVETDWHYKDKDGTIYASILAVDYMSDGTVFTAAGDDDYRNK